MWRMRAAWSSLPDTDAALWPVQKETLDAWQRIYNEKVRKVPNGAWMTQKEAQKMLDENEITRRAQAYAMETREHAEKDADNIYTQACVQADKILSGACAALSRSANDLAQFRDSLLGAGQAPENR